MIDEQSATQMISRVATMLLLITLIVPAVLGFAPYADNMPNGRFVPNPCPGGGTWRGVGHTQSSGGGIRNLFGEDFASAGHQWTNDLCRADSDGDGKSNGQELGDPDCSWNVGGVLKAVDGHPGVCEPMDLPHCQHVNRNIAC